MMPMRCNFVILVLLPLGLLPAAEPLSIGTNKQLLVDDFVIDQMAGITRALGHVTKANNGKPVFTDGRFYGTVLHDQQRFKLWYREHGKTGYGLAQSSDGIHFTKQAKLTGINFAGDFTLSVEIDPHDKDPAHRYKGAYDAPGMAAGIAHSADGIRWHPYNAGKPITHRAADTYNQIFWDPLIQKYRLSTRTDFGTPGGDGEIRGTRTMTNANIKSNPKNWKMTREWIFDREGKDEHKRRQVYAKTYWIYESVYFLILSVYDYPGDVSEGTKTDHVTRHQRDVMNYYIATSRDGHSWDLQWVYAGQPLVPRGPAGAFDKDLILPASSIITHQNKHWIYYGGANERHGTPEVIFQRDHAIGLATLRLDGFVGLRAGNQPGIVITKPFKLIGDRLSVNVDAGM
ncbi:MAG: hypothetical protein VX644_02825, partial [Planctomycetota bacterium]|nr:hypothetical protein [Planctomycetota bacterium]